MALQKSIELFGTTFPNAYHRITDFEYKVEEFTYVNLIEQPDDADGNPVDPIEEDKVGVKKQATVVVNSHIDQASRTNLDKPVLVRNFVFEPDLTLADNILEQGYSHLKTLVEFTGSLDV